jgi:proline dehydrogenase
VLIDGVREGVRQGLRTSLLVASRQTAVRGVVERMPVSREVVGRFVAGSEVTDAVAAAHRLVDDGLTVSLDHLGEDTTDRETARSATDAALDLLDRLVEAGLAGDVELSVKLSALGQGIDADLAVDNAAVVCDRARRAGTTVTLDMEDHTTTDATLEALRRLRADFPDLGAVLQAYLRRTEADCRDLAGPGSRVRLCKGAYDEPVAVAYGSRAEVDASYRRCLQVLVEGSGYPMVATHDPALVDHALTLLGGRGHDSYEFQMLYGIRPVEQQRLAGAGHRVRVYVPYGEQWYGYLVRRLAERPANLAFFLRALASRG